MNFSNLRRRMSAVFIAGTLATLAVAPVSAATLLGETVHVNALRPTINDVATDLGNFVVGNGVEVSDGTVQYDIGANSIIVTALQNAAFTTHTFNGRSFSDALSSFSDFLSFSVVTSDFSNVQTSFDANNLFINFGASGGFSIGDTAVINFTLAGPDDISAVPVPAALPLFGTGLAIMGFVGWRRKKMAA